MLPFRSDLPRRPKQWIGPRPIFSSWSPIPGAGPIPTWNPTSQARVGSLPQSEIPTGPGHLSGELNAEDRRYPNRRDDRRPSMS